MFRRSVVPALPRPVVRGNQASTLVLAAVFLALIGASRPAGPAPAIPPDAPPPAPEMPATGGPLEYTRSTYTGTYQDIRPATALSFSNNDDGVATIPLPFDFMFDGAAWNFFSYLAVTTNGYAYLTTSSTPTDKSSDNQLLYSTSAPYNVMAPWWDDLNVGAVGTNPAGQVVWKLAGSPGSRTLTVQWTNVSSYYSVTQNQPSIINFQLVLEEGSNAIEFRYGPVTNPPGSLAESASIGLKGYRWIDAVTGSNVVFNAMMNSNAWPSRFYRFEPGTDPALAAGTYTVGSGGDYPTLSEAVAGLNRRGIAGSVVFQLTDGDYPPTTNNFPILIAPVAGASAGNPVTIEAAGAAPVIRSAGATAGYCGTTASPQSITSASEPVLALVGADFVTLRNLALQSTGSYVDRGLLLTNASATDGASDNLIEGVSVSLSLNNSTSTGIVQEAKVAPTSPDGTNSRNTYRDLSITSAACGIYLIGNAALPDEGIEIGATAGERTVIGGAAPGSLSSPGSVWGIRASGEANLRVHDCEIRNLTGTGSALVAGIWLDNSPSSTVSSGTCEFFLNRIHGLVSSGTASTSVVRGLYVTLTTNATSVSRIYNNVVYDLTSAASNTGQNIAGISIQSGGGGAGATHNVDFNTVRLEPAGRACSNTNFQIGTATGPVIKVRNNVFANFTAAQGGTSLKHSCWYTPSTVSIGPAGSVSDHNVLYVAVATGGCIGMTASTARTTISDWRNFAGGLDVSSLPWNPQFVSATDLHISSTDPTPVEGSGSWFDGAITWAGSDIDGDLRNGTTPDIGADEGEFVPVTTRDVAATQLIAPASGSLVLAGSTITPRASFSNLGVALPATPVRFRIVGPAPDTAEVYSSTVDLPPLGVGSTGTVVFASGTIAAGGTYTMTVRSLLAGDENPANDQIGGTLNVAAQLAGTYLVGAAEPAPFNSLSNAVTRLNFAGMSESVTFLLTDATNSAGNLAIVIQPFAGAGPDRTLTIKPAPGVIASISGTALSIIILNGADYVTIDGSSSDDSRRDLTIVNGGSYAYWAVGVWLSSQGPGAGCTHNVIKNCRFKCLLNQLDYRNNTMAIHSGGIGVQTEIDDGYDNDYNQILNNEITQVAWGIYLAGAAGNPNDGNVVANNLIGPPLFSTAQIGKGGIVLTHQNGATVSGNEIRFVGLPAFQSSNSADRTGIALGDRFWPTVYPRTCSNTLVTGNLIHDICEPGAQSAVGIHLGEAAGSSGNIIANNMIYDVKANGSGGHQAAGILVGGSAASDVVAFNSISLAGPTDDTGGSAATESVCGIRIGSTAATNLTVKNNAISLDVTSSTPGLRHFAIAAPSASFDFGTGGLDHNDYFVNAANPQAALGGLGAAAPYTPVATLTDWRTRFTPAVDAASLDIDPLFVSATDLHLQPIASPVMDGGTPIAGITIDFDGEPRNASTPAIGADELVGISGTPEETSDAGEETSLSPVYPNPSPGRATVRFTLKDSAPVSLRVIDVQGRLVRTLTDATLGAGPHSIQWDGRSDGGARVSSGWYLLRLETGGNVRTRRLLLIAR